MKWKEIIKKILETGIWIQPIVYRLLVYFLKRLDMFDLTDHQIRVISLYVSVLSVFMFWTESINQPREKYAMVGKQKAMYPDIPKTLLHKIPSGILLGKDKKTGTYVCKKLSEDGHVFLVGGSGSGKSPIGCSSGWRRCAS